MLIDTQIALWSVTGNPKLSDAARLLIENADKIWVSAVSIWEIAIKYRLQRGSKNDMPIPGGVAREQFEAAGFAFLSVTAAHAAAVDDLPPLHGDPFDRMLIAQAQTESMRLLTADELLASYGAVVVLA